MMFVCLCVLFIAIVSGEKEGEPCMTERNTSGTCVKTHKCPSARTNYETTFQAPAFCSYKLYGTILICCDNDAIVLQAADVNTRDTSRRRVSEIKCKEYNRGAIKKTDCTASIPEPGDLSTSAAQCDYHTKLIISGERADTGEFPHLAAIGWMDFYGGYEFACAGSLISPRFVMTAGHCTSNPNTVNLAPDIVRLGDQNIDNNLTDGADHIDIPIRHIHKHPEYHPPRITNDIALLELSTNVTFSATIRPACLWTRPDFGDYDNVIATGWAIVDNGTTQSSKELHKVSLSLIENYICDHLRTDVGNRYGSESTNEQLCTMELREGKASCQGTSGSPVQVASKEDHCIFHLLGVTSYGSRCAGYEEPTIYIRVSSYLDWIEGIVWPGE